LPTASSVWKRPGSVERGFSLATRPEKGLGSAAFWDTAEGKLKEALEAGSIPYELDPGGGAFYAPKIDIFLDDALGREWQMATIQADPRVRDVHAVQLPARAPD